MFLQTDEGYVNLNFVRQIRRLKAVHGVTQYILFDAAGAKITTYTAGNDGQLHFDDVLPAPTVGAAAGTTVLLVSVTDDVIRPGEEDVFVQEQPVVAWRLNRYRSEPVLADHLRSEQTVLLPCPGGKVLLAGDQLFDSIEQAKATLLKRAQRKWDEEHRPPRRRDMDLYRSSADIALRR